MTNTDLAATMYKTGAEIFEDLVFMYPTRELEDDQRAAAPRASAEVNFRGVINGKLVVTACGDVLPQLAANMLGDDEQHGEQTQRDALGEVANIICGNLLPEISDSKAVFQLDSPNVMQVADKGVSTRDAQPSAAIEIGLDGGRADLMLFINE